METVIIYKMSLKVGEYSAVHCSIKEVVFLHFGHDILITGSSYNGEDSLKFENLTYFRFREFVLGNM